MSLSRKVKIALDETRLLILGAQVLFGFQFQGVFQEAFRDLPVSSRYLTCLGQLLMALAIGLLIAPSMQHQLVEKGRDTARIHRATGRFAGAALLPFQVSLGVSVYIVFEHLFGLVPALLAGTAFCLLAGSLWYALALAVKRRIGGHAVTEVLRPTPLAVKIDQMLTEARVILPGAQALLGFQLSVTLTSAFAQLPAGSRLLHVAALCCVALAVILLMTPAALHRIAFGGEDVPSFFRMGSWFVVAAPLPLAFGLAADLYVAAAKAAGPPMLAAILAAGSWAMLVALWYALPLSIRSRRALRANQDRD